MLPRRAALAPVHATAARGASIASIFIGSALIGSASIGCAVGGADSDDDSGSPTVDTEPRLRDEGVGSDSEFPPDAELEDVGEEPLDTESPSDTAAIFDVDPGCTATCTVCGGPDACGGTCKTGSCSGGGSCIAGTCVTPTRSFVSPSAYPGSWGAFARGISWTLASEGAARIFYTTDGSIPTTASPSGPSPLTLSIPSSGTVLRWLSDNGVKEGVQSFTVQIGTSLQSGYGYAVDSVKLDGVSPTVVASPGAVINGSARYQAWVSTGCPACRQQLVYGVGNTAMGCLYDWSPSTYPGVSGTASTRITAPTLAGIHKVRVAWALQLNCSDALGTANPLGTKPTADIATIVVR